MKYTEKAYAKINLWLDVKEKRPDGYHNLESLMQTVSLHDTITVEKNEQSDGKMIVMSDDSGLPEEENICVRAAELISGEIERTSGITAEAIRITLKKNIPIAAGLGGGSADAAAVLRAVNKLHKNSLDTDRLCALAKEIGADVPFCIFGGTSYAYGTGEILNPVRALPDCFILIADIKGKISTADAYKRLDSEKKSDSIDFKNFTKAVEKGDICKISKHMFNSFEILYEDKLREIKEILNRSEPYGTLMSGSGLATFGIYNNKKSAEKGMAMLEKAGYRTFVTTPQGRYYN